MGSYTTPFLFAFLAARCPCPSNFLLHLVKMQPEYLLKIDDKGRSVLALALESGHSTFREYDKEGCIHQIVLLNRDVVGFRDPKTSLFPFMTAACSEDAITDMAILDCWIAEDGSDYGRERAARIRTGSSLTCLNTVYFLLREAPWTIVKQTDTQPHLITPKKRSGTENQTGQPPRKNRAAIEEHLV